MTLITVYVCATVLFDLHFPFCCRYLLRPPSDSDVRSYVDNLIEALLQEKEMCSDFNQKFSKVYSATAGSMSYAVKEKTACRLVSKKMVHDGLSTRKAMLVIF